MEIELEKKRLEVYPPIHKLGSVGKWIRDQLLKGELVRSIKGTNFGGFIIIFMILIGFTC